MKDHSIDFIEQVNVIIDRLIRNNFDPTDRVIFKKMIKSFLDICFSVENNKRVDYIIQKFTQIYNLFEIDTRSKEVFRKLVGLLIELDNQSLLDIFATYFLRTRKFIGFYILLEELVEYRKDTTNYENLFINLSDHLFYRLKEVEHVLNIIHKDEVFFISKLIEFNKHAMIRPYVSELIKHFPEKLPPIISFLINKYDTQFKYNFSTLLEYLDIIHLITDCSSIEEIHVENYLSNIINNSYPPEPSIFQDLVEWFFIWHYYDTLRIISYCKYLINHQADRLASFEENFLDRFTGSQLLNYAVDVSSANKRRVLQYLIDLRDEHNLVKFIHYFPEYKNLIPML